MVFIREKTHILRILFSFKTFRTTMAFAHHQKDHQTGICLCLVLLLRTGPGYYCP